VFRNEPSLVTLFSFTSFLRGMRSVTRGCGLTLGDATQSQSPPFDDLVDPTLSCPAIRVLVRRTMSGLASPHRPCCSIAGCDQDKGQGSHSGGTASGETTPQGRFPCTRRNHTTTFFRIHRRTPCRHRVDMRCCASQGKKGCCLERHGKREPLDDALARVPAESPPDT